MLIEQTWIDFPLAEEESRERFSNWYYWPKIWEINSIKTN